MYTWTPQCPKHPSTQSSKCIQSDRKYITPGVKIPQSIDKSIESCIYTTPTTVGVIDDEKFGFIKKRTQIKFSQSCFNFL